MKLSDPKLNIKTFFFSSLYTARPSFEYYWQVHFVNPMNSCVVHPTSDFMKVKEYHDLRTQFKYLHQEFFLSGLAVASCSSSSNFLSVSKRSSNVVLVRALILTPGVFLVRSGCS